MLQEIFRFAVENLREQIANAAAAADAAAVAFHREQLRQLEARRAYFEVA